MSNAGRIAKEDRMCEELRFPASIGVQEVQWYSPVAARQMTTLNLGDQTA